MTPPDPQDRGLGTGGDDDDSGNEVRDNSLGRLLTLSDGVFAIAMTLLTFDIKVPSLGPHPSESALRHALGRQTSSYLAFLLSFYVIASYWRRHRLLMRYVVVSHPRLVGETILLLLLVAAMPFPTSLLSQYGSNPFALAIYGVFNLAALLTLMQISRSVEKYELFDQNAAAPLEGRQKRETVRSLAVFALSIPAGYVIGHDGPWVLVGLAVPLRFSWLVKLYHRRRAARV